ncbi:MAG: DsrE family protein [Acidimicrobiia bacterium]|nr:DsrE family protein [Acidimicrobiia bacterium]
MIDQTINVRGKTITTFIVYEINRALSDKEPGEVLEVVAEQDNAIRSDITSWAEATGHQLIEIVEADGFDRFLIRKSDVTPSGKSMALIVSDPGLEELLSPLGFALAGALEGENVYIYFQGPAVRVLERRFTPHLKGWWRRMFSPFARRGLERAGHVSPHEKLRELQGLGAKFYACAPSMDRFRVAKTDLAFPDVKVVEYLTFVDVMAGTDVQLYP